MSDKPDSVEDREARRVPGGIAWMARNSVAANLLMLVLVIGGFVVGSQVTQEVFPELELDIVLVSVAYRGASPEEVENGVLLSIEEAVQGVDGVKRVTATASEASATLLIELLIGTDPDKALAEVKNRIDRITSFPADAERPQVSLITSRREVLSLVLHGEQDELTLRSLAEEVRDTLLADPGISQVELAASRPLEIAIEVPAETLRRYGLTLEDIAQRVRQASVEVPGGSVKTRGGEVLVRTDERKIRGEELARIRLLTAPDGSSLLLGDIATIADGFQESDEATYFNGEPAVVIKVFRVGKETPIEVAAAVDRMRARISEGLPAGVSLSVWQDTSEIFAERLDLLLRNAGLGLVLVLVVLGLFLDVRLAFWVTLGIPISFLGSLLVLPAMDVSINMISLFAYILTLGIVVDDAIVIGENIYEHRQGGASFLKAAVMGAREVAVPVTFSILTTVAAFMPLFFIPGVSGKFFRVIPAVVVTILLMSLLESLFVLPAHLAHGERAEGGIMRRLNWGQRTFGRGVVWFVERVYDPLLTACLSNRGVTICAGLAALMVTVGLVASGRVSFVYLPKIESDLVTARIELPFGAAADETRAGQARLVRVAQDIVAEHGGEKLCRGIFTQLGGLVGQQNSLELTRQAENVATVQLLLRPSSDRPLSAFQLAELWRRRVGEIPGVEKLSFDGSTGPAAGAAIDMRLSHRDRRVLEQAARELARAMRDYPALQEIDDGLSAGKPQLNLKIKPEAQSMGLSAATLGRQVRAAFAGVEAQRLQRGRDELRILVRYPQEERRSIQDIEAMIIRAPVGGEIALAEAADISWGRSETEIVHIDGRRSVSVSAELGDQASSAGAIKQALLAGPLAQLLEKYPGLSYAVEGQQREQAEVVASLGVGALLSLLVIYGLLAVPFKSYIQPLIIMSAIPFGFIGVVIGHMVMSFEMSIVSMMGIVALAGVIVNDSLVLIAAANDLREQGHSPYEAIVRAARRRFRPIWLTSLTTFFGLVPMILETSLQARFLIPMAISLAFGVLFGTILILLLVPALYLLIEDARAWLREEELPSVVHERGQDEGGDEEELPAPRPHGLPITGPPTPLGKRR